MLTVFNCFMLSVFNCFMLTVLKYPNQGLILHVLMGQTILHRP